MIDDQVKALINAALDRELTATEAATLGKALDSSAQAQEYQRELQRLDKVFRSVPQQQLPEDLHERIVDAIALPLAATHRKPAFSLPGFLRYGAALTAGLLIAAGVYEFFPSLNQPSNYEGMAGTMVPNRPSDQTHLLDALEIRSGGLHSTSRLELRDDALVLEVVLQSGNPVDLRVSLAGEGFDFGALAQSKSQFQSFEFADRLIMARGTGMQQFTVLLKPRGDSANGMEAEILLEFSSDGRVIGNGRLKPLSTILKQ